MKKPRSNISPILLYPLYALLSLLTVVISSCNNSNNKATTPQQIEINDPLLQRDPVLKDLTGKLKTDPQNADLFYKRGVRFHQLREDTFAIRDFKSASSLDTNKASYYSEIGSIYFDHKDIAGALQWIKKAIQKDPKDVKAHLKICKVLLFSEKYEEAVAEANLVMRTDPYNPEPYFLKGMIYKLRKDTAHAIGNFESAVQVSPDYKDAIIQLALIYSARKNPLALKYLDNAARVDSTDVFPIFARAVYMQDNNQTQQAKDLYKQCIIKNTHFIDAYFNLGYIYMQEDSVEKAYRQYDIVTKIDQMNPTAYYDRGVCNESMNKTEEAIKDYQQAIMLDSAYQKPKMALKRLRAK